MHVLSLCSGVGTHDVALGAIFDARTVCYVEREAFAAAQLVALMEAQCLDAAPIWSDLATFDAREWRDVVDCIVAGLPCQPYSVAGKQLGNDDHRAVGDGDGPIAHFVRIVDECRPAVVFLENVTAWVSGGWFRLVGEQLCGMGYEIEDPLFLAADDVGASHQRERVWIVAHQPDRGRRVLRESWRRSGCIEPGRSELDDATGARRIGRGSEPSAAIRHEARGGESGGRRDNVANSGHARSGGTGVCGIATGGEPRDSIAGSGAFVADADDDGRRIGSASHDDDGEHAQRNVADGCDPIVADARCRSTSADESVGLTERDDSPFARARSAAVEYSDDAGREERRRAVTTRTEFATAECAGGTLFAPGPQSDRWPRIVTDYPHLAPAIEPGIRRVADGFTWVVDESRRHQLRAIGNGGVPLCAAVAWGTLAQRVMNR